jgi:hypothetical protein
LFGEMHEKLQQIIIREASTLYNRAFLLQRLNSEFPHLMTDAGCVNATLSSFQATCGTIKNAFELLPKLAEKGRCTVVVKNTYRHTDNYDGRTHSKSDRESLCLESKYVLLLRVPNGCANAFTDIASKGCLPPGVFCYPRYKVYAVTRAMRDVELHCLDQVVHLSSRVEKMGCCFTRGAWWQKERKKRKSANNATKQQNDESNVLVCSLRGRGVTRH